MTPWVLRLIVANVAVFFLQKTVPDVTGWLALLPAQIFLRPWTAVTYMFLHDPNSLGHILFNMLTLYFFGPRVEARLGGARFLRLYLLAGLSGALLSFVFSPLAWVVGASGAIYGVLFAFARYWPRERIYIWGVLPVEAWILVIAYALIDLFGIGSGVAHFAHLGGFVGAWVYLAISDRRVTAPARQWKAKVGAPVGKVDTARLARIDLSRVHEVNREELNRILDKISAEGMASLTNSERTFLSHFAGKE